MNGLIALILGIIKTISGYIVALFLMIIESAFFALPIFYIYGLLQYKYGLPNINYLDIAMILTTLKCIKFSTFNISRMVNDVNSSQIELPVEKGSEKSSDS